MKKIIISTAASMAVLSASPAMATTIFHYDDANRITSNRAAGGGPSGRLTVDTATTISRIGFLNDLSSDGKMKFFIFDAVTGANLFTSATTAFIDDGESYKWSDKLQFTFKPGMVYSIGAASSVSTLFVFDRTANSTNGFNFLTGNQNLRDAFEKVTLDTRQNCCDVATAFEIGGLAAVPEPATWAFMIFGFGAIGGALRTRRKGDVKVSYA